MLRNSTSYKSDTVNESDFIFDDSDYNNQITMVGNVHHETEVNPYRKK